VDSGIVTVDQSICLGHKQCGICTQACPYGSPQFGDDDDAKMQKCDLCAERWQQGGKPICVDACLMRALDAGPLDELKRKYGDCPTAAGFPCPAGLKPSVVMKPRQYPAPDTEVFPQS
jgi:anaerobic dimethyl sulfoxide reductase subunit B (iron-sulfur subunit)